MARDPILSSLHVEVLTVSRTILGPAWNMKDYSDNVCRLYYTEEGEGFVRHHGQDYRLRPGRLMAIPAHTVMSYWCPEHMIQRWIHFNATLFGGMALFDCLQCEYEVPADGEHVMRLYDRLKNIYQSERLGDRLEANGLLLQLLAPFVATADSAAHEERRRGLLRFRRVLEYIDQHAGERIPVGHLAELAHLERAHFTRLFTSHFGLPPARFILQQRIERAMRLLWESNDKIETIGERLGFSDGFHFSKTFRRLTGASPSEFRKQPRGLT